MTIRKDSGLHYCSYYNNLVRYGEFCKDCELNEKNPSSKKPEKPVYKP